MTEGDLSPEEYQDGMLRALRVVENAGRSIRREMTQREAHGLPALEAVESGDPMLLTATIAQVGALAVTLACGVLKLSEAEMVDRIRQRMLDLEPGS